MKLSLDELLSVTQGKLLSASKDLVEADHFITDSRKIKKAAQGLFVPLITAARDGHDYMQEASKMGVRTFLCSHPPKQLALFTDCNLILVKDTLAAMQQLAAYHRAKFDLPIIGITGSNGKTIVKEWLAQMLAKKLKVVSNPKSFNSQVGVPISVSRIDAHHEIGIFEAGISKPGEMKKLQQIIQPTIGLFTMIGAAHEANFEHIQQKIQEKLQLFKQVDTLYCSSWHEEVRHEIETHLLVINPSVRLRTWGNATTDALQITGIDKTDDKTDITAIYQQSLVNIRIPFTDDAYIENAIHCWLILLDMDFEPKQLAEWFGGLSVVEMRLELIKGIQNCTIINDTYSSDLASISIALDYLYQQKQHPKFTIILSDIEDHSNSKDVYAEVLHLLESHPIYRLLLIGHEISKWAADFQTKLDGNVLCFQGTEDFLKRQDMTVFNDEAILIKGARKFALERIVHRLEERIHGTVLQINLSALIQNVNFFRQRLKKGTKLMAMVKAFSYGSGTYEVANVLVHHGVDYFAVAYVDEGIALRKKGITTPILVLNPNVSQLDALLHYQLDAEVYSSNLFQAFKNQLLRMGEKLHIHLKVETGMHRLGLAKTDLPLLLDALQEIDCFEVKSVFSHLVGSDNPALFDFTMQQKTLFEEMSQLVEERLGHKVIKHLSNSGGAIRNPDLQFDMVRLGIGLYGIDSDAKIQEDLEQISTLKSSIAQIKNVPQTETVGYSRAGVLQRDTRIATVNIGYADGYSRAFSNGKGKVLIHGQLAPVVGNVCMDMIMVDVTDILLAAEGDEVIIFSPQLPVSTLAEWIGTIPYEIIAGISQRVKRVFYHE